MKICTINRHPCFTQLYLIIILRNREISNVLLWAEIGYGFKLDQSTLNVNTATTNAFAVEIDTDQNVEFRIETPDHQNIFTMEQASLLWKLWIQIYFVLAKATRIVVFGSRYFVTSFNADCQRPIFCGCLIKYRSLAQRSLATESGLMYKRNNIGLWPYNIGLCTGEII